MIVLEKYNLQKTNSVIKLPSLNYSRFADCLESLQYAKPQFYKKYELFLKSLFLKCISYYFIFGRPNETKRLFLPIR